MRVRYHNLHLNQLLSAEPQSVSTKHTVLHADASWSVLVFSVIVIKDTNKQTLNCLIELFEEEELMVNHTKFYQINQSHPSLLHETSYDS